MERFLIVEEPDTWNSILKDFKNIDCYYSFEYGSLFAENENGKLFAAYFEDSETKIFYPFIRREIPHVNDTIFDIVTPYGYGGPIIYGKSQVIIKFYEVFSKYCKLNKIITETIRLHPLYENYLLCKNIMDLEYIRQTTAVDLTPSLDQIRMNYTSVNKRNIKKARKHNLTCVIAEKTNENIQTFIDLYKETMDRNKASSYYYFNNSYFFEQVNDTDICRTFLLFAKMNNEIIAGVLVFVGQEYSHYHLGASKTKFLELRPNNILFDFMIEFCRSKGSKILHLGGGYKENDGLFKFKTSFTNNNNYKYFIGKKVHDTHQYQQIIEKLSEEYLMNENFFPMYRGKLRNKLILT
ncbi:GNAT family N-acetyltransferase [Neobacillus sp. PS3-34]|uniref:lipid II:glycine glycyltransferase FemX n=1 Tax=Neobacillus sp. PS3-34 TaxID=3070678 RepID=UPI0027E0F758|nr:GNAT family N-acetyltransferase [Neobacillus sp. PS3-34]WML47805.1 GNAT family N-acetyltransferase [Neobacillus sp. PS3-34]